MKAMKWMAILGIIWLVLGWVGTMVLLFLQQEGLVWMAWVVYSSNLYFLAFSIVALVQSSKVLRNKSLEKK